MRCTWLTRCLPTRQRVWGHLGVAHSGRSVGQLVIWCQLAGESVSLPQPMNTFLQVWEVWGHVRVGPGGRSIGQLSSWCQWAGQLVSQSMHSFPQVWGHVGVAPGGRLAKRFQLLAAGQYHVGLGEVLHGKGGKCVG